MKKFALVEQAQRWRIEKADENRKTVALDAASGPRKKDAHATNLSKID